MAHGVSRVAEAFSVETPTLELFVGHELFGLLCGLIVIGNFALDAECLKASDHLESRDVRERVFVCFPSINAVGFINDNVGLQFV